MQKYQSIISGTNGSVIRNVPVMVLKEDGSLAEIFLDREGQVPAPNPLATDSRGVFYFYAKNGRYSLRTSVDGITITDADAVLLNDPEEITTAGPIADAVLRAEAAAQRAEDAVEASGIPELVEAAQNAVEDAQQAVSQAGVLTEQVNQTLIDAQQAKQDAESAAQAAASNAAAAAQAVIEAAIESAEDAASDAADSAQAASSAAADAANAAAAAAESVISSAVSAANAAKQAAELAHEGAEQAKSDAQQVLSTMQGTLDAAVQSATEAAEEAKDDAEAARDAAQASAAAWAYSMPDLVKANPSTPCIIKTSATTLAIKAGTHAKIGNAYVSFAVQTDVEMPSVLTPGEDYAVFVHPDGTASAAADPFFAPAAAPVPGALKIGGFHCGLEAPGLTLAAGGFATSGAGHIWTQADVDEIAGINAWSIWDLQFRPGCDPRGMFLATPDVFVDIYLLNDQHIANGTSRYNTAIASGTVPPVKPLMFGGNGVAKYGSLTWFEAWEIMQSHGKRLLTYDEFAASAYGVTENQSLGGASSTPPATLRQAGFTSKGGGQQFTGHVWVWGANAHGVGGTGWVAGAGRGQTYGTPYAAFFGGHRGLAAFSGSRASAWDNAPWGSDWSIGARAACDRLRLQ